MLRAFCLSVNGAFEMPGQASYLLVPTLLFRRFLFPDVILTTFIFHYRAT